MIINGDSLEELKALPANSVDAIVTDPPYGLGNFSPSDIADCMLAWASGKKWQPKGGGFMGKSWDAFVPPPQLWREAFRVLKAGGHALVFAGTRTQDLMSISLRLAGFEIRDCLMWLYGSGFPKSHNIAKAIDRHYGLEGEVIGKQKMTGTARKTKDGLSHGCATAGLNIERVATTINITAPSSEDAKKWEGWGTALKPAYEPIILARKPLDGTVVNNILLHGVGGLNIDEARIDANENLGRLNKIDKGMFKVGMGANCAEIRKQNGLEPLGRWPANILLDEIALKALGPAGRYFYTAKASQSEREAGLKSFDKKSNVELTGRKEGSAGLVMKHEDGSEKANPYAGTSGQRSRANIHPTVKPIDLMRYLCRLITPEGGTILEPFAGSGTTLIAAHLEGYNFIGIEREAEYVEIIRARLKHWQGARDTGKAEKEVDRGVQLELFS